MGFFSAVASAAKSAVGKVSSTAKKVVKNGKDKIKKASKKVREKASKSWGTFTGKEKADKAKKIFYEAKEKYEKEKDKFNKKANSLANHINEYLFQINDIKNSFFDNHLIKYKEMISNIRELHISSKVNKDNKFNFNYNLEKIDKKNDVIMIDFDNNKFKSYLKATFSLGFYTRRKAAESLEKANNIKHKVNLNIEKMKAEIIRLKNIKEFIQQNILKYFVELSTIFKKIIGRLKFSYHYLKNNKMINVDNSKKKLNARNLPNAQIETFRAADILVKILAFMSSKKYLNTEKLEIIEDDAEKTTNKIQKSNIYEISKNAA